MACDYGVHNSGSSHVECQVPQLSTAEFLNLGMERHQLATTTRMPPAIWNGRARGVAPVNIESTLVPDVAGRGGNPGHLGRWFAEYETLVSKKPKTA